MNDYYKKCQKCNKILHITKFIVIDINKMVVSNNCIKCDCNDKVVKKCALCNEIKPITLFVTNIEREKYVSYCTSCRAEYDKQYRIENPEKFAEYSKKMYDKHRKKNKVDKVKCDEFHKQCSGCNKVKSIESFGLNKTCRDGHCIYCKECAAVLRKKYYKPKSQTLDTEISKET